MRNREEILADIDKVNRRTKLCQDEIRKCEYHLAVLEEELKNCKGEFNEPRNNLLDLLEFKRRIRK